MSSIVVLSCGAHLRHQSIVVLPSGDGCLFSLCMSTIVAFAVTVSLVKIGLGVRTASFTAGGRFSSTTVSMAVSKSPSPSVAVVIHVSGSVGDREY